MTKISKIIDELNNQQADAAWITTPLNVYYFTGYRSEPHERLFALLIKDGKQVNLFLSKNGSRRSQSITFHR
ncbi:aminopeptidase P family N-terminal domain-containing protein [Staphylococcus aureus]